jgi:hypothetical protein
MKSLKLILPLLLITLSAAAHPVADAEKSFDKLKTLAGSWEGTLTTSPATDSQAPSQSQPVQINLRVTSMGYALLHEANIGHQDADPITMFYVENNQLMLTHYGHSGNRPRMVGKISDDGNTIDFNFIDAANYTTEQGGHAHHVAFNFIDADHHTEDWTLVFADGSPIRAHLDLHRTAK